MVTTVTVGNDHYFHTSCTSQNFKIKQNYVGWPRGSLTTPVLRPADLCKQLFEFLIVVSKSACTLSWVLNNDRDIFGWTNIRANQTGVINDPPCQTHSHANSEHCFLLFCFSRFEKWGWTTRAKTMIPTGHVFGFPEWITLGLNSMYIDPPELYGH